MILYTERLFAGVNDVVTCAGSRRRAWDTWLLGSLWTTGRAQWRASCSLVKVWASRWSATTSASCSVLSTWKCWGNGSFRDTSTWTAVVLSLETVAAAQLRAGGEQSGIVAPGAAVEGAQNSLTENILTLKSEFAEWTNSSVSQQTVSTHLVYLASMLFVFPRLYIDVVQFCSKSASFHFAAKS